MKVLCILNPGAAGGMAVSRWLDVARWLDVLGCAHERLTTEPGRPIDDQVCGHLNRVGTADYDVIAGIGGDGTHAAVINALMGYRKTRPGAWLPPYAFIPMGTGNDIAKSLGIRIRDDFSARDLRRAVSTIVHGADYALDLGVLNGRYFADALTVGLDSGILRERNAHKQVIERIPLLRYLARGRFLYTWALGSRFLQHERVEGEIVVDGNAWYKGPILNLVVNNTRIYAGDFDFSAEAYPDDGLLDVVVFTAHTDYLARYLLAIRHNPDRIRDLSEELHRRSMHAQGRSIRITMARSEPAQLDGEEIADGTVFEVGVEPRVLRIKTPAEPV
jgi:diacylglycerol kinase family enzyme